jgi:hypothetical protein
MFASSMRFAAAPASLFPPVPDAEGLNQRLRSWLFEEFVP